MTGAANWERETFRNPYGEDAYYSSEKERNLYGFVAEYKGEYWDRLFLSGALRYDRNDHFKDAVTYSASAAYLFPKTGTRLHGSVGTGAKNPSFYQQFGTYSSTMTFVGNPDLTPETSFGWDAGIEQKLFDDRFLVDFTYFNERLRDEITYSSNGTIMTYYNADGTSKRQGLEVSAQLAITDDLHVKASYTYLESLDPDGKAEVRRPKHSGSLNVTQAFLDGKAHAFADAVIRGEMTDNNWSTWPATTETLDDYVLLNVGADYQVNDKVQIYGRVENLLDADYQEVYGYNTAGITGFVGLKATF